MSTQTAYGADSHLSVLPPIGEATYEFLNHCHRLPDTRLKPPYTRLVCHFCDKRWVLMQQESPFDPIRQVMTWVEYPNNASIQWDDPAFEQINSCLGNQGIVKAGLPSAWQLSVHPSGAHQVQFLAMGVATTIWKRTTPFSKHCQFVLNVDNENNKIDVCEEEAEFGVYMGIQTPTNGEGFDVTTLSVSFCLYHTIYQESIWIGGGTE